MATDREQKLVDICFQLVATALDDQYRHHFACQTQESRMAWVANQLKECGFPTKPCGLSWGVLKSEGPSDCG